MRRVKEVSKRPTREEKKKAFREYILQERKARGIRDSDLSESAHAMRFASMGCNTEIEIMVADFLYTKEGFDVWHTFSNPGIVDDLYLYITEGKKA